MNLLEITLVSDPKLNYNGGAARKLPALRRCYAAVLAFWAIPEAEGPFPPSIEAARRPLVRHLGGRNSAKTPPPPLGGPTQATKSVKSVTVTAHVFSVFLNQLSRRQISGAILARLLPQSDRR